MKIAFIGFEDIKNPFLWSGIPFTLYNKFRNSPNVEIKVICSDQIKLHFPISALFKRFLYNKFFAYKYGVYRFDRENWCIKANSEYINKELAIFNPDVILCCNAYQITQIKTNKPIFIYTDATFKQLNTYYTDYMRYCKEAVKTAQLTENLAFKKAEGIIFSSNWAKQSAMNHYHVSTQKISIIPFGSNLKLPNNYQLKLSKAIDKDNFSMIFVGYDYERKGLNKAIEVHESLILNGINSKLTIVGPNKLPEQFKIEGVTFLGKLEMKNQEDCLKLLNAYDDAHFLILPTKADCTPIVFSEAASIAIPTITHAVGGTDEIIKNGVNGIKLPLESSEEDFVKQLLVYINSNEAYQQLRKDTYQEYCDRLNWDSTVSKMICLFSEAVNRKK
jgi:glycosyltransferase involved in cell wall biosynthesis